ncbi:MAG: hypothetical protein K0R68_1591 [Mycobacterium sp.]|jgi:ketosteroid isomerase-like protein|nr:hypothetical protein [Mycobacterium sp.]
MENTATAFVDALQQLHQDRDVDALIELFTDDVVLTKAGIPHEQRGRDGARAFWTDYRDVFDTIESSFTHTVVDDGLVFLEWQSTGTLKDGKDFSYDGVSVLEGGDEGITAFRTYYDTAAFLTAERRNAGS